MKLFLFCFGSLFLKCSCFECPKLAWSDEFDNNELNEKNWEIQLGDGCDINLCGWGNNEWQTYAKDNIQVSNGALQIVAKASTEGNKKQFTSARIRSIGKQDFLHGYFEARVRLPIGQGIWPAFWMMPTKSIYGQWPRSGEIDIMENIGKEHSTVHGTLHYSDDPSQGNQRYTTSYVNLWENENFSSHYHNFALLKQPDSIAFYLDGSEYSKVTKNDVSHWPFEEEFHFILNLAVGGLWPGYPDETTQFPQVMEVDYIRVHTTATSTATNESSTTMFGNFRGARRAEYQEKNVIYVLQNGIEDYTYSNWSVPEGSSFVQTSNNSIAVDFASSSGYVKVTAFSPTCNVTRTFSIAVSVNPPFAYDFSFVNTTFGQVDEGEGIQASGTYEIVDNPLPEDFIHPSSPVVKYVTNPMPYDNIAYSTDAISDVNEYVHAKRRFFIDIYTDAPVGTELLIQLEDQSAATPANFPTGRHSRYRSRVPESYDGEDTIKGWKRVAFHFVDQLDPNIEQVDSIVLMLDPGYATMYTWYFDHLDSYLVVEDDKGESS